MYFLSGQIMFNEKTITLLKMHLIDSVGKKVFDKILPEAFRKMINSWIQNKKSE